MTASKSASATVKVANRLGLHARAAAKFVKMAERFDADVNVHRGDMSVAGTSIMGLMMLAAASGEAIRLTATGPDAETAINSLVALVESKFDED
ncbi:MAG: HPr family phosphocarrier protein [Alphaproteobacteria bacterium]|nr:HPr family phosphocarrier protein [Alphaproteobacteria bacterium]